MPAKITVNFFDRSSVDLDPAALTRLKAGGQGIIYTFTHHNQQYVLKAIPDEETMFRRVRGFRDRLISAHTPIPPSVQFRGLPVGQGVSQGSVFGLRTVKFVYLLVFNWVEGEPLQTRLEKDSVPLSPRRRKIAKNLLTLLVFLARQLIVHSDLYPDNLS